MSAFASQVASGLAGIARVAGVAVIYSRGGSGFLIPNAVPGKSDFKSEEQQAVVAESRTRDYIVPAASLVLNGVTITPQRGDTITELVGSLTQIYAVGRPDGGADQPWRYSDHGQMYVRIHTRLKTTV